MNIVYIHSHDTGRYIQPYGYAVPTPHLMKLAEEGVLFRQAYAAAPTCSASRAALLTGMTSHSCGMLGLTHRGFQLKDYDQHLVRFLNRQGYETVLSGIQHEAPKGIDIGYSKTLTDLEAGIKNDLVNAELVSQYIKNREQSRPMFLSFGMHSTHREFPEPDKSINPDYILPPWPIPDDAKTRKDMAGFIASAKIMDHSVGVVINALKEAEMLDNTMVIYTTDHGIAFPGMKCSLRDTGTGVSLIIKHPNFKQNKQSLDALVSHIDLYPTICEVIGAKAPEWLQGVSLVSLLKGNISKVREEVFSELTFHASYEPMRCIRTKRYKFISFFDDHDRGVLAANIDDGLSKALLIDHGLLEKKREKEELYDLLLDPLEQNNLVRDDKFKSIYEELSLKLVEWMKKTNDPILYDRPIKPEGARINTLDSKSPRDKTFI